LGNSVFKASPIKCSFLYTTAESGNGGRKGKMFECFVVNFLADENLIIRVGAVESGRNVCCMELTDVSVATCKCKIENAEDEFPGSYLEGSDWKMKGELKLTKEIDEGMFKSSTELSIVSRDSRQSTFSLIVACHNRI
jgi:hypothetical protein